jgi:uncharacterized Zn-binding protein involved in type VI secretion
MYLYLREVIVNEGASGDAVLTFEAASNSGFKNGELVVGKIGTGDVTVTVSDQETSNSDFDVTIRIKENVAGALKVDDESLKFVLPDGFVWKTGFGYTHIWGDNLAGDFSINIEDSKLTFDFEGAPTYSPASFELVLSFEVSDETKAETGDILVNVSGKSDRAGSDELVVGTYGENGGVIEIIGEVPTVFAGQLEQEIADIQIREVLAESFINGRTITLTLPAEAKWYKVDGVLVDKNTGNFLIDSNAGDELWFAGLIGNENRTIKLVIKNDNDALDFAAMDKGNVSRASADGAKLRLENCEIATQQGFEGDIEVAVGGTQDLDGDEIVVANCVPAVRIAASSKPQVKIGLADQVIGDLTITEAAAGAIRDKNPNVNDRTVVLLDAPDGVQFSTVPIVEVVSGDLKIDESKVTRQGNNNQIVIPIEDSSYAASAIKVSGLKLTVDRTAVEGDVIVKVQGSAVTQTGPAALGGNDMWINDATAASTAMATVMTPAPGGTTQTVVFTIGSTEYKVGNVTQTMDVAPYIKGDRTYLPIRYVGYALGIADQNILWDDATKTETLSQGNKVVQVKIGSTTLLVNGVAIAMDVAPEITNDRTMLPFRFIGQAFGANFVWDDATKTVTMTI